MESEGNEESEVRRRRRSFVDLRLKGREGKRKGKKRRDGRVKSVKGERVKGRRQRGRRKESQRPIFVSVC